MLEAHYLKLSLSNSSPHFVFFSLLPLCTYHLSGDIRCKQLQLKHTQQHVTVAYAQFLALKLLPTQASQGFLSAQ